MSKSKAIKTCYPHNRLYGESHQAAIFILIPRFHSRFHLHYFVRDMNNSNSHVSRLWMALTLQEVIHSRLQETAQLCLWQPCVRKPGNTC